MNDYFDRMTAAGHDSADRKRGGLFPSIYLPKAIYEALPAAYMSVGTLFIAGAIYIGIGQLMSVGYLAVGVSCILGGITVSSIRRAERAK